MPARPGDGFEFSQDLERIATAFAQAGESEWADRVRDTDQRIRHLGYGEGPVAEAQREFARATLEGLRGSPAVVAICPNCHRRAHLAVDAAAYNATLRLVRN